MIPAHLIRFDRDAPPRALIAALVKQIAAGRPAVIPTETQYALTADATSARAVETVRAVKGRSASQPFSVFLSNARSLEQWRVEMPSWAQLLAETFWPGPLTLILPTHNRVFNRLGSAGSVGVRVSPEPIVQALIGAFKRPLLATSANPSGAILSVRDENNWLADGAESGKFLWVRPRRYDRKPPSTVLDCCGPKPKLVRAGAIGTAQWRETLRKNR